MKKTKKALSIFLVLALCFAFCLPAFAATTVTISNPYENIDWSTVNTYKAALHSHTNASDGDMTLLQSLERHAEAGFDIVAITDHGTVDRGWTSDNSTFIRTLLKIAKRSEGEIEFLGESGTFPNGMSYSCCTAQSGDEYLRVDGKKEILRIPFGIENNAVSVNAHVNSWFVDYCNNCKTGLASECDVPCHHPWYCWHEGEPAIVQSDIVRIEEYRRLHGYVTAQMYEEYKRLRKRQRQLIWKGRRKLLSD